MDFEQANQLYINLKQEFQNGNISEQDFLQQVEQIRVQTSDGIWWSIDPVTDEWMYWDGQKWLLAEYQTENKDKKLPRTLFQLLFIIIKGFFKNLPKMFKNQIIKLIVIFAAVIAINTYLVVVKNEGFAPMRNNKLLPITSLQGMMRSATIFWTFAAFFFSEIIDRIKRDGFKAFFVEVIGFPTFLSKNFKKSNGKGLTVLLTTVAVVLPLTLLFKNRYLILLYGLMAFFSYTKREESFLLYIFKLGSDDIKRITKKKSKTNPANLFIMVISVAAGFFTAYLLPKKTSVVIILAIVLFVLALLIEKRKINSKAIAGILFFIMTNIIYFKFTGRLFADDGGWRESGGTLGGWIRSPGAAKAVSMGVPPALGSLFGTLLGGLGRAIGIQDIIKNIDIYSDSVGDLASLGLGQDTKVIAGTTNEVLPDAVDTIKNNIQGQIYQPNNENALNWTTDLIKNILGTKQGMGVLEDILKSTPLRNFSKEASDAFLDFIDNNTFIDDAGKIIFYGDDSERLRLIKNMVNSSKASQILNGVSKGLFWGGIVTDTMMNYAIGDSVLLAGTKAISNGYLMSAIGEANPGVAVMELGNFVLFGGSKAADCISPTKTITGAVNLAYDMIFKDQHEWQDRLKDGVYGPNMKNFVDGAGIVKDAVTDPGQFWDDFSQAVQVDDVNGDMWTDMYKTSDELWRLPDNVNTDLSIWHPFDSARTVGCAIGRQVTNGVIAIGEGAARAGQYLGEVVANNPILDKTVTMATDAAGAVKDGVSYAASKVGSAVSSAASAIGNAGSKALSYIGSWFK